MSSVPSPSPREVRAIIFDLYGTLIEIGRPRFHKGIPRALAVGVRPWMEFVRQRLLTTAFDQTEELIEAVLDELPVLPALSARRAALELLNEELQSISIVPGTLSLLSFLKNRGYKLGLLSNLSSPHKQPVRELGLSDYFDAACFSCDEGIKKPKPEIYLRLCERLSVTPEQCVMVGDSLKNDVEAPTALGMRALLVSKGPTGVPSVSSVTDLGWMVLDGDVPLRLIETGGRLEAAGSRSASIIKEWTPLADDEQGRYNLVARARVEVDTTPPSVEEFFAKRYLFPESAYVEELAHRVVSELGLPCNRAVLIDGKEPFLLTTVAHGSHYRREDVDPELAYEVARHAAAAYIFANADLRARNAIVSRRGASASITMIDLEHFFFAFALDLTGLGDPYRPHTVDALSKEALSRRIRRRVLTERTTKRAMRSFLELDSLGSEIGLAFKSGWVDVFDLARGKSDTIFRLLEERIYQEPFLIIGTRSHRRAMALADVRDIESRMRQDAEAIFPNLVALERPATADG